MATPLSREDAPSELGAYGLRIGGLKEAERWMQPVAATAPALEVEVRRASPMPRLSSGWVEDRGDVRVDLLGGGRLDMTRGTGVVRFLFPTPPPPPSDILHPYLAVAASVAHAWLGREAIHAGAIRTPAGAVMVLGSKEDGKSSTLAWLAAELGVDVLADDLCVLDNGTVLAGPRCIDLRAPTARHYESAWRGRLVRSHERFRLTLPAAADGARVIGTVVLRWGDRLRRSAVSAPERLAELGRQRGLGVLRADPAVLLDLATLPMVALERPRQLASLPAAAAALVAAWS